MANPLKIEYVPVADLKHFAGNPRQISDGEMKKLRRSIKEYGFVDPAIVQKGSNMIIGGHQRIEAAKLEGIKTVPVVYLDGISDERAWMLNVALNKISGEWDWPKLGDLIGELDTGDIDLELTGFDENELEGLLNGLDNASGGQDDTSVDSSWQVVIECRDESEQSELYEKLTKEGYECRLLIL